jgi:hypothetical protein
LPSPPPGPPSARAGYIALLADEFAELLANLHRIPVKATDADAVRGWLDEWEAFVRAGRVFSRALETGDPTIYRPAGNAADGPSIRINEFARYNGMDACILSSSL